MCAPICRCCCELFLFYVLLSLQACTTNLQLKNPLRERLDGVFHVYFCEANHLTHDAIAQYLSSFFGLTSNDLTHQARWSPRVPHVDTLASTGFRLCVNRMSIIKIDDADGPIVRHVYSPCIYIYMFTMMLQMDRSCEKGNALESPCSEPSELACH